METKENLLTTKQQINYENQRRTQENRSGIEKMLSRNRKSLLVSQKNQNAS